MTQFSEYFQKDIVDYLKSLRQFQFDEINNNNKNLQDIMWVNADEVPVYLDMSTGKTYHQKGEKNVELKKTTGAKSRLTVLLGVSSFGAKFPPYIIIKSLNKSELKTHSRITASSDTMLMDGSIKNLCLIGSTDST